MAKEFQSLVRSFLMLYKLARPYGRRKLFWVFVAILFQAFFQAFGVASVLPFLILASDANKMNEGVLGDFITRFFPEWNHENLLILAGAFAITILLLSSLTNLLSELLRNRYAAMCGHDLTLRTASHFLNQPYEYFLNNNTPIIIKKCVGDVQLVVNGILMPLLEALSRLVMVISIVMVLFFMLSPWLICSVVMVFSCFYVIVYTKSKNKRTCISDGIRSSMRNLSVYAYELFAGIKVIFANNSVPAFFDKFEQETFKYYRFRSWVAILSNSPRYILEPMVFGGVIVIVMVLIIRGEGLTAMLPALTVVALAGYRILPSMQLLYSQLTMVSASSHALQELSQEFDDDVPTVKIGERVLRKQPAPMSFEQAIEFKSISFSYSGAEEAVLDQISMKISAGSSVAFVGATGSGKTTLVDILLGLLEPSDGTLWVDKARLERSNIMAWRDVIGYVPQETFLTNDTVASNIAFGHVDAIVNFDALHEAARIAQIDEFIKESLPQGYDTKIGERGVRLSGGQRQRLGLARALYRNPSVLVLDEATSALDNEVEARFVSSLQSLPNKITKVMIAHRLSTVRDCDAIYLLRDGRIVDQGSYDELKQNSKLFQAFIKD